MVDQLVAAGYAERVRNADDGRSVHIGLTDEGFDLIDAAVTDHVATQARLTAGLTESDMRGMNRLLAIFLATLDA